jgi:prophage tail gpP-like protein
LPAVSAYQFTCEVPGIVSATGAVWQVDTVANVVCEAFGINEPMYVLERELSQDRNSGQRTRLKLIPLGALVLGEIPQ